MAARKGKGRQAVRNGGGGIPGWVWALAYVYACLELGIDRVDA